MKKMIIIVLSLVIIGGGLWYYIYNGPMKEKEGKKAIEEYMTAQNVNLQDVTELRTGVDFLSGVYIEAYVINADSENEYIYSYSRNSEKPYDVNLLVMKDGSEQTGKNVKYPKLTRE
ncbi:DUF3139 domain-containing protein [Listeria fleischmannii]|uniref:DUF3139 domain-containing protein n=1 Tax=Listeria fleischmannii TaxID=1069827 RepID=UPI0016277661|nr:DUF3139 domain-containing protein [Listeria fleischmannii]MBC1418113.1 DUF3139 domain-containing protein [Listeria fleischmannii]